MRITNATIDAVDEPTSRWARGISCDRPPLTVTSARPSGFLAPQRTSRLVLAAGWVTDPEPFPEDVEAHA
ncbi:hypothetical protein [Streptomyces mirabilis]|jgi:hypothetical protein|uniref:Uncharacterized protein n=1 Tax=Streptomyces mirabilis TaxID=68239 RepID=A0A1I2IWF0_9ACTN|nr:hypothetical protein [Streptomyces mirabilis]SFF46812.1 hypothetical protein SAMN02787118_10758 [Streptomyces mirabilis]